MTSQADPVTKGDPTTDATPAEPTPIDVPPLARPAIVRFALTSLLFLGWMGYLAYLVFTLPGSNRSPDLVSRPQILVSELDVLAKVESVEDEVLIEAVLYPKDDKEANQLVGTKITVTNLDDCHPVPLESPHPPKDFRGPGQYLLPLRVLPNGSYAVVRIPASPGFATVGPPRIYAVSDEILAQYQHSSKPASSSGADE